MFKGLINYKDGKIPFVVDNYRLELFSENDLQYQFSMEFNLTTNYVLRGQCFDFGNTPKDAIFLVENSFGNICNLKCFIVYNFGIEKPVDSICIESGILDSIFRYKYHYLDLTRAGVNLGIERQNVYSIPFKIRDAKYQISYLVGRDHKMGLLDKFDMRGKTTIKLKNANIGECYNICLLMNRFAKFITSMGDATFERITILGSNGLVYANLYCTFVSNNTVVDLDVLFGKFQVQDYAPKILDNLALELECKITHSIPLGHLKKFGNEYSPQRFLELITAFEYLFEKLKPTLKEPIPSTLKEELQLMFEEFPDILAGRNTGDIAKEIKKLRVNILHGYEYYYDFNGLSTHQFYTIKLSDLILRMSLRHIGFDNLQISRFKQTRQLY